MAEYLVHLLLLDTTGWFRLENSFFLSLFHFLCVGSSHGYPTKHYETP